MDFFLHYCKGGVSIHAPREGCDIDEAREGVIAHRVSIHAPREGCDPARPELAIRHKVSIHAPREGCDCSRSSRILWMLRFQFTHPGRGATQIQLKFWERG